MSNGLLNMAPNTMIVHRPEDNGRRPGMASVSALSHTEMMWGPGR